MTFQSGEAKNRALFDLRLGGGHIGRHQALPEPPASDGDLQQPPEDIAKWMAQLGVVILITFCVLSTLSVTALAQEDQAPSADEIARQLADPNAVIGSLNFNLDHITYNE